MARAREYNDSALRARLVPAFEVRTDGPVGACDQHPAWFTAPSGGGDCGGEVVRKIQDLGTRHESGLVGRKVGSKQFVEPSWVNISETVRQFLNGARFGKIARETFAPVGLFFAGIRHVGGNIDQADDGRICACFGNHCASVTVSDGGYTDRPEEKERALWRQH